METPFIDSVLNFLGNDCLCHLSEEDMEDIRESLSRMEERGYTVMDAAKTVRCYEAVTPDLDEDVANARIARISFKYPLLKWKLGPQFI